MSNLAPAGEKVHVCFAEMQTAGKGRRGRSWISPFGENIYLSIGSFVNLPLSELGGLSLVAGMEVVATLRHFGARETGLKWPNDVIMGGGKLAGILVELKPPERRGTGVVIGVGMNLLLSNEQAIHIEQNWTQLSTQLSLSRNTLAGELVGRILAAVDRFRVSGFTTFAEDCNQYNLFADKEVRIIRGDEQTTGIDRGVNEYGNLLLETSSRIIEFNSGEVSLRPVDL
jgi:BirA family biotin operon repressor/biotin-[acetyl-CoA-carboxylase] ligase